MMCQEGYYSDLVLHLRAIVYVYENELDALGVNVLNLHSLTLLYMNLPSNITHQSFYIHTVHAHMSPFTSAMLYFTVLLHFLCCHGYRHSGLNISRQFAFVKGSVHSGFQLKLCATPSTSSAARLFRQTHTHTDIVHLVLKDTSQIPTQVRRFAVGMRFGCLQMPLQSSISSL